MGEWIVTSVEAPGPDMRVVTVWAWQGQAPSGPEVDVLLEKLGPEANRALADFLEIGPACPDPSRHEPATSEGATTEDDVWLTDEPLQLDPIRSRSLQLFELQNDRARLAEIARADERHHRLRAVEIATDRVRSGAPAWELLAEAARIHAFIQDGKTP